jgi:molybdate/tungstate transport system permease protein
VSWLRSRSPFIILSGVLGAGMVIFLMLPIVSSILGSATGVPGALEDAATLNAIATSFYCAFLATLFTFLLGVPLAYIFARRSFAGKGIIDPLIDLPILIPHNAAGIALLMILSPASPIGGFFQSLGVGFVDTAWGIVAAMAFVSAPFMIRSAQDAFIAVDPAMEHVAKSLGASELQAFRHITFPLAARGVLTGCLLTWARSISEFGAVVILAYYPITAPIHLFDTFVTEGLARALPINGLLIIIAVIVLLVFSKLLVKQGRLLKPRGAQG